MFEEKIWEKKHSEVYRYTRVVFTFEIEDRTRQNEVATRYEAFVRKAGNCQAEGLMREQDAVTWQSKALIGPGKEDGWVLCQVFYETEWFCVKKSYLSNYTTQIGCNISILNNIHKTNSDNNIFLDSFSDISGEDTPKCEETKSIILLRYLRSLQRY